LAAVRPCPARRWIGGRHELRRDFGRCSESSIVEDSQILIDRSAGSLRWKSLVTFDPPLSIGIGLDQARVGRSLERFELYPSRLLGDSGYGSAEMLGWPLYEHGIEPHVTVFDKSARTDGTFSREDFTYDHASDVYRYPGGKVLTTTGALVNDGATMLYVASKRDCDRCALKYRCCPKQASLIAVIEMSLRAGSLPVSCLASSASR
jgi:hypothetical protein